VKEQLHIQVAHSDSLSAAQRRNIIALCNRAYEEDLEPLFNTFTVTTHVLGYDAGSLVTHALWVTRWLQVETKPAMRTAYIEAVATEKAYRHRGLATTVMERVAEEIQDFDLAALSPFSVAYYARLGWELWRGPLFIRTAGGLLPSPAHERVMILRLSRTPALDLDVPLSAEWRAGELW
jgi:aminoglycoside 2'-N-acetyltransferase I